LALRFEERIDDLLDCLLANAISEALKFLSLPNEAIWRKAPGAGVKNNLQVVRHRMLVLLLMLTLLKKTNQS